MGKQHQWVLEASVPSKATGEGGSLFVRSNVSEVSGTNEKQEKENRILSVYERNRGGDEKTWRYGIGYEKRWIINGIYVCMSHRFLCHVSTKEYTYWQKMSLYKS